MMKKELLRLIFSEFQNKKFRAENIANKNKAFAEANKDYKDLVLQERFLKMQIGRLKFEGQDTESLVAELENIDSKKEEILNKLGLRLADLEPQYECKKCKDTGVLEGEVCTCFSQAYNNKLMQKCNVVLSDIPYLEDYDYKFFSTSEEQAFATKCVKTLSAYVENFDNLTLKNIVMCGASGTGKTYLTKCIAKK